MKVFNRFSSIMIHIFLLCYNESVLLPHTVAHYNKYMPSAKITIYDNESSDNSVEIAKALGCNIVSFKSENIQNEYIQADIKNTCWKNVANGWIIVADMDEWLCITETQLDEEQKRGTTILKVKGIDMIGESVKLDLCDINLHTLNKYVEHDPESKSLCFLREKISAMNYNTGAHQCKPVGKITHSTIIYYNKHMCNLGLVFLTDKMIKRYERTKLMRMKAMDTHYTNDVEKVKMNYMKLISKTKLL